MAFTRKQFLSGSSLNGNLTIILPGVVAGNLLVVAIGIGNSSGSGTLSDSQGNVYNVLQSQGVLDAFGGVTEYWTPLSASGSLTVTLTTTGTNGFTGIATEYSSPLNNLAKDGGNGTFGDNAGTIQPGNITTGAAPDLIAAAVVSTGNSATWAVDSGMTLVTSVSQAYLAAGITPATMTLGYADLVLTPAGPINPTFSGGNVSDTFIAVVGAIKGSGSPPANPTKLEISFFGTKRFGKAAEPECTELPVRPPVKLFGA